MCTIDPDDRAFALKLAILHGKYLNSADIQNKIDAAIGTDRARTEARGKIRNRARTEARGKITARE